MRGRARERTSVAALLLGAVAALAAGCSAPPTVDLAPLPVPPDKTVVTVNGEPLSLDEFDTELRLMQIHYSAVTEGQMRAIKLRLFEQVVNRRLLVQEAQKEGLRLTQREADEALESLKKEMPGDIGAILKVRGVSLESWKRKILQEKLAAMLVKRDVNSKVHITPSEVEDYYWFHLPDYWKPPAVRLRHLVVQRKGDLEKALQSLKQGMDFAKVASVFSVGPAKDKGGDWGFVDEDRVPSDYLKAMASLKPGEISKPLKDNFGYHLFQLIARRPREMASFAEVKDRIHGDLLKTEEDLRFDQWMADLKAKSVIRVNKNMAPIIGINLEDLRGQ
jgi:parvulin-like peptidyl-prolyl isomerase